jgi:hypothetical protein
LPDSIVKAGNRHITIKHSSHSGVVWRSALL